MYKYECVNVIQCTGNGQLLHSTQEYEKKNVFPNAHRHPYDYIYVSALKTDYLFKKSPVFEVIK